MMTCPTVSIVAILLPNGSRVELSCSGHGVCFNGTCICDAGRHGAACEDVFLEGIPLGVRLFVYSLATVGIFISLALIAWTVAMRQHPIIQRALLAYLLPLAFGCVLWFCAVFPIGADNGPVQSRTLAEWELSRGCNAQAWLLSLGCVTIYSSMVHKVWRILRLVESSEKGQRVPITQSGVREQLIGSLRYVCLTLLLLSLFTALAPLEWRTFYGALSLDDDGRGVSRQTVGLCDKNESVARWRRVVGGGAFLAVVALQLALAAHGFLYTYRARGIPSARVDGRAIATALALLLQMGVLAILLNLATRGVQPLAQACVKWAAVLVTGYGTLCLVYGPKLYAVHFPAAVASREERRASMRALDDRRRNQQQQQQSEQAAPPHLSRDTSASAVGSGGPSRFSVWQRAHGRLGAIRALGAVVADAARAVTRRPPARRGCANAACPAPAAEMSTTMTGEAYGEMEHAVSSV